MGLLETKAQAIAADMAADDKVKTYALDPMSILTIVSVLVQVVEFIYECYKDHQQTAQVMQNPGIMARWRLRRIIRDQVNDSQDRRDIRNRLFRSTLNVGKTVTAQEAEQLHAEAQSR